MRAFTFTTISIALAAALVAAVVVAYVAYTDDPFSQPGETWTNNDFPSCVRQLRLLNSGKYVLRVSCEMSTPSENLGRWSESHALVTLVSDKQGTPNRMLEHMTSKGCAVLASPGAVDNSGEVPESAAFFPSHSTCVKQL